MSRFHASRVDGVPERRHVATVPRVDFDASLEKERHGIHAGRVGRGGAESRIASGRSHNRVGTMLEEQPNLLGVSRSPQKRGDASLVRERRIGTVLEEDAHTGRVPAQCCIH